MCACKVSEFLASSFFDDLDGRLVIFKQVKGRTGTKRGCFDQVGTHETGRSGFDAPAADAGSLSAPGFPGQRIGMIASQKSMSGEAALSPAFMATISDSHVE